MGEGAAEWARDDLEPGDQGSSRGSATDNLGHLGQVKLQAWALFSHLQNAKAGQDDLESPLTPLQVTRA